VKWLEDMIPTEIAGDLPSPVNAGTRPALNLTWSHERSATREIKGTCPWLKAGGTFEFGFRMEPGVGPKRIICEYSSANDIRYRSIITLEDRTVVNSEVNKIR
jgi:hypothetical protein